MKVGAAPAAIPNTAAIKSVVLKATFLPMRSDPRPQNEAPTKRPAIRARDRKAECSTLNSNAAWLKASDTVVCQSWRCQNQSVKKFA